MKIQIDDAIRDATEKEVSVIEAQRTGIQNTIVERDARIAARNAALSKLGLTQQEISAIFG